jgi:hypothetical protein
MMRSFRVSYRAENGDLMQTKPMHPDEAEKLLEELKAEGISAWAEDAIKRGGAT